MSGRGTAVALVFTRRPSPSKHILHNTFINNTYFLWFSLHPLLIREHTHLVIYRVICSMPVRITIARKQIDITCATIQNDPNILKRIRKRMRYSYKLRIKYILNGLTDLDLLLIIVNTIPTLHSNAYNISNNVRLPFVLALFYNNIYRGILSDQT